MTDEEGARLETSHRLHPWSERLLHLAAAIGAAAPKSDALRSFTTILLAFFKAGDPASRWFQAYMRERGVPAARLLDSIGLEVALFDSLDGENLRPSSKVPWTRSARQLLGDADRYVTEKTIRPYELLGAYVYGEASVAHRERLAEWEVLGPSPRGPMDWANAFLSMVSGQLVEGIDKWIELHQRQTGVEPQFVPRALDLTPVPFAHLGGARAYLHATTQPRLLDVEALVVPLRYPSPKVLDDAEAPVAALLENVDKSAYEWLSKEALEASAARGEERMQVVATPPELTDQLPPNVVFCVDVTSISTPDRLRSAIVAIIERARSEKWRSIAVPFPAESGDSGSPLRQAVLDAVLSVLEPRIVGVNAPDIHLCASPAAFTSILNKEPAHDTSQDFDVITSGVGEITDMTLGNAEATALLWAALLDVHGGGISLPGAALKVELDAAIGDVRSRLGSLLDIRKAEKGDRSILDESIYASAVLKMLVQNTCLLALRTTGSNSLSARHVAVALILDEPRVLAAIGVDVDSLRFRLIAACLRDETIPASERARWHDLFPALSTLRDSELELQRGYANDGIDARHPRSDKLNINRQANLFAELIVNPEVRPPLSIGLFGNWGTGKSFFMKRMESEIERLQGKPGNISRVVQVTFNAWHFVDANLWASLATKIFDDIAKEISKDLQGERDARSSEQLRAELHQKVESSRRQVEEAARELQSAQSARAKAVKDYQENRGRRLKEAMRLGRERWNKLEEAAQKNPQIKAALEGVRQAVDRHGLDRALATADGFEDLLEQVTKARGSMGSLWHALLADVRAPRSLFWVVLLPALLVAALVLGGAALVDYLAASGSSEWLQSLSVKLDAWKAEAAKWGSLLAAGLTWLSTRLKSIANAADHVREIIDKTADPGPREDAKLRELDEDVLSAKTKMREAERRVAENQQELQRIEAGGLVYDFLESRRNHEAYLKYKGLISVVRDDFESLREAMTELQGVRPVERVVLYIDDLDRCRPQRVVEVLEAVHLLLSFPLFVVIVAVDSRWLRTSLERAYRTLTGITTSDDSLEPGEQPFTAQNYLEKIFQIPFSLARMDRDGFASLVDSVLEPPPEPKLPVPSEAPADAPGDDDAAPEPATADASPAAPGAAPSDSNAEAGDAGAPRAAIPDQTKEGGLAARDSETSWLKLKSAFRSLFGPSRRLETARRLERLVERDEVETPARDSVSSKQAEVVTEPDAEPPEEAAAKAPETIRLEDHERVFIHGLHAFIRTPRQTKRFVNIYRLIRPKPGTPELEIFAGTPRSPGYQAVLLILASNVGYPAGGGRLLRALIRNPGASGAAESRGAATWSQFLDATRPQNEQAPEWAQVWSDLAEWQLQSAHELYQRLSTLGERLVVRDTKSEQTFEYELPSDIDAYREHAIAVGRYSFDWNVMLPGESDATRPGAP